MTMSQVLNFILLAIIIFNFMPSRRRALKEMEAQRPVLDLATFETIYDMSISYFGKKYAAVIAKTCLVTAHRMNARVTVDPELRFELSRERSLLSKSVHPDRNARFKKLLEMRSHIVS